MSNLTVTVSSLDGRTRTNITISAGQTVKHLIDEACQRFKLSTDGDQAYELKHGRAVLDPTASIRLSGLAPGAKLELAIGKRTPTDAPSLVTVALQYVGTSCSGLGRLTTQVPSRTSLWCILAEFQRASAGKLVLILEDGGSSGKCWLPHLVVLGQEYGGMDQLMGTTLAAIGIGRGNCVARMTHKQADIPYEQARALSMASDDSAKSATSTGQAERPDASASAGPLLQPPQTDVRLDTSSPVRPSRDAVPLSQHAFDRKVALYRPPARTGLRSSPDLPDSHYEMGKTEFQYHFSNMQARAKAIQEAPLVSQAALLQRQRAAFLEKHPTTIIRFRLPDQYLLEATFGSEEDGDSLFVFMRSVLLRGNVDFELATGPPARRLKPRDKRRLWELDLVPAAIVNVSWTAVTGDLSTPSALDLLKAGIKETIATLPSVTSDAAELESSAAVPSSPAPAPPSSSLSSDAPDSPARVANTLTAPHEKRTGGTKKPSWLRL